MSPGLDDLEVKFTVHVMFHHDDRFPVNFTLQGRLTQDALSEWNYNAEITPKGQFGRFKLQQSMYTSNYLIFDIRNLPRGQKHHMFENNACIYKKYFCELGDRHYLRKS